MWGDRLYDGLSAATFMLCMIWSIHGGDILRSLLRQSAVSVWSCVQCFRDCTCFRQQRWSDRLPLWCRLYSYQLPQHILPKEPSAYSEYQWDALRPLFQLLYMLEHLSADSVHINPQVVETGSLWNVRHYLHINTTTEKDFMKFSGYNTGWKLQKNVLKSHWVLDTDDITNIHKCNS